MSNGIDGTKGAGGAAGANAAQGRDHEAVKVTGRENAFAKLAAGGDANFIESGDKGANRIAKLDKNGDNRVSLDEFLAARGNSATHRNDGDHRHHGDDGGDTPPPPPPTLKAGETAFNVIAGVIGGTQRDYIDNTNPLWDKLSSLAGTDGKITLDEFLKGDNGATAFDLLNGADNSLSTADGTTDAATTLLGRLISKLDAGTTKDQQLSLDEFKANPPPPGGTT